MTSPHINASWLCLWATESLLVPDEATFGPSTGQGPGKQKPSTLLLLPCCFPHGNTHPPDLGPPLHYGEAQESLPRWGHIECSRRNVQSIKNSSRDAASALTRAQTGPGRPQQNGTCEEAQKEETDTNNRPDADISRQTPAESVTRTQATVHTPRGGGRRDTQIMMFMFTHMQRDMQSVEGGLWMPPVHTGSDKHSPVLFEQSF